MSLLWKGKFDSGLRRWSSGKESACQCRRGKRHRFNLWVGKIPWRRAWQPIPVFLPGESHGQRSLAGYSPRGHTELDTAEKAYTADKNTPSCTPMIWHCLHTHTCFNKNYLLLNISPSHSQSICMNNLEGVLYS